MNLRRYEGLTENSVPRVIVLYHEVFHIPMGTNCAPLVADLFYFAMKKISF